jgi:hypothetical protein
MKKLADGINCLRLSLSFFSPEVREEGGSACCSGSIVSSIELSGDGKDHAGWLQTAVQVQFALDITGGHTPPAPDIQMCASYMYEQGSS